MGSRGINSNLLVVAKYTDDSKYTDDFGHCSCNDGLSPKRLCGGGEKPLWFDHAANYNIL